jgi:hypothetical protein
VPPGLLFGNLLNYVCQLLRRLGLLLCEFCLCDVPLALFFATFRVLVVSLGLLLREFRFSVGPYVGNAVDKLGLLVCDLGRTLC